MPGEAIHSAKPHWTLKSAQQGLTSDSMAYTVHMDTLAVAGVRCVPA